ncbi:DNA ligase [Marinomonas algarum]|uniref:DNA ligase n=1 Tax=Marinomonas algarum TaxID=2883105 RepID=A0A9X1IJQ7_9GAMM|nr:DNA ligase [Marinomonas algarum]MCB5160530.1 DNA ligase [Marinomonas algarum]
MCVKSFLMAFLCLFSVAVLSQSPQKLDVQLATLYSDDIDVTDYLISEKYDGVRAIWTGQRLLTRQGNPIHAPDWFTDPLPNVWLDGELWSRRKDFEFIVSTVRKHDPIDKEWRQIRYMIFDAPDQTHLMTFEQRVQRYSQLVKQANLSHLVSIEQVSVTNNQQLSSLLEDYIAKGAEGLMLHRKEAKFESGRTDNLLKLKPHMDAEATVIKVFNGSGKYDGMMGSVLVEMPSGLRFKIGSGFTDLQRQNPPEKGQVLTYKYHGFTARGVPRFASFMRYRDEKW